MCHDLVNPEPDPFGRRLIEIGDVVEADLFLQPHHPVNINVPDQLATAADLDRVGNIDRIEEPTVEILRRMHLVAEGQVIGAAPCRYVSPFPVDPVIFVDPLQGSQGIGFHPGGAGHIIIDMGSREPAVGDDGCACRHGA